MSGLTRTALRLAAIAAMEADPVLLAMCGTRIFDSRIVDLDADEPVPVIVVMTEDENGDEWSRNNGGPPFHATVDLVVEISMRAVVASDGDTIDLATPYTDSELEASLDLLEDRVTGFSMADTPQSKAVRDFVVRRVRKMRSSRFVLPDTGVKLATRMLLLTTELHDYEPDDPSIARTGPFAALPDPLRSVCAALPVGSDGYKTGLALAAKMAGTVVVTPITGVDMTYAPQGLTPTTTPAKTDHVETYQQKVDLNG